ncbi:hypothetical protein FACS1894180_2420 [Bacteroidia bacterium]|nr:hypothetical protein FACS1894180_2420 [Bacteroidia bacterium]
MKTNTLIKITVVLMLFAAESINAQSPYYYYYKGEKQYLTLDSTKLNLTLSGSVALTQPYIKSYAVQNNLASVELKADRQRGQTYTYIVNALKQQSRVIAVHSNYITSYNDTVGISTNFYVKLKQAADFNLLANLANQKHAVIVEQDPYMPLWYLLSCSAKTPDNTLNTANWFYETGLFVSAAPEFLAKNKYDNVQSNTSPDVNSSNTVSNNGHCVIQDKMD